MKIHISGCKDNDNEEPGNISTSSIAIKEYVIFKVTRYFFKEPDTLDF